MATPCAIGAPEIRRARRNRGRRAIRCLTPRPGVQGWIQASALSKPKMNLLTQTQAHRKSCERFLILCKEVVGDPEHAVRVPGRLLAQFLLQAILQLGADLCNFHASAYQKLAAQEFMRAVFIGELTGNAAILAILIPAESSVGDCLGADVLKAAKNRVLLRDLKGLPKNFDFYQPLIRAKDLCSPV